MHQERHQPAVEQLRIAADHRERVPIRKIFVRQQFALVVAVAAHGIDDDDRGVAKISRQPGFRRRRQPAAVDFAAVHPVALKKAERIFEFRNVTAGGAGGEGLQAEPDASGPVRSEFDAFRPEGGIVGAEVEAMLLRIEVRQELLLTEARINAAVVFAALRKTERTIAVIFAAFAPGGVGNQHALGIRPEQCAAFGNRDLGTVEPFENPAGRNAVHCGGEKDEFIFDPVGDYDRHSGGIAVSGIKMAARFRCADEIVRGQDPALAAAVQQGEPEGVPGRENPRRLPLPAEKFHTAVAPRKNDPGVHEKLLSVVWRLHIISGSILFPTIPRRRKQNNLSNDRIRRKSPQIQSKQRRLRTKPDATPVRFQSSIAGLAANGLNVIRA